MIGSAVFTFIDTNKQTPKQTDKPNLYIDLFNLFTNNIENIYSRRIQRSSNNYKCQKFKFIMRNLQTKTKIVRNMKNYAFFANMPKRAKFSKILCKFTFDASVLKNVFNFSVQSSSFCPRLFKDV